MADPKRKRQSSTRVAALTAAACAFALVGVILMNADVLPGEGANSAVQAEVAANVASAQRGGAEPADSAGADTLKDGAAQTAESDSGAQESSGSSDTNAKTGGDGASLPAYVEGHVLAQMKDGQSIDELNAELSQLDYVAHDREITEGDVALGWATIPLAEGQDVESAAQRLVEDGATSTAQPDYLYHLKGDASSGLGAASVDATGNVSATTEEGLQTAADDDYEINYVFDSKVDDGSNDVSTYARRRGDRQWAVSLTHIDEAYVYLRDQRGLNLDAAESIATRPSIAILDTGAQLDHPDLVGNIVASYDAETQTEGVTDGSAEWLSSSAWHGTSVASLASARTNNGIGITGAGGNAGLVPVKVSQGRTGETPSSLVLRGIEYVMNNAEAHNIKVINLSLGFMVESDIDQTDRAVCAAINRAAIEEKVLTVIAAGNNAVDEETFANRGAYVDFPSYFAEHSVGVIGLWMTTATGDPGRFPASNYNTSDNVKVEQLGSPGSEVFAAVGKDYGSGYERKTNTSSAAPIVSGIAALALWENPDLSVDELKSVLYGAATDISQVYENGAAVSVDSWGSKYSAGFDAPTGFGLVDALETVKNARSFLRGSTTAAAGVTVQLTPHVNDQAESPRGYIWASSNPAVATVNANGQVTGVSGGATVITATSGDLKLAQIVTVHDPSITGGVNSLYKGKKAQYTLTDTPVNNGTWTWSSSNARAATVDSNGVVTGVGAGTATITATLASNPGVKASRSVTVLEPSISGVDSLYAGSKAQLTLNYTPGDTWTWSSSNARAATVDSNGVVTGVSAGTATITATLASNPDVKASKSITVRNPAISGADSLYVGDKTQFTPIYTPGGTWTWSSSNARAATVDQNGVVTGVGAGTATITATLASNPDIKASKSITVANKPAPTPTPKVTSKQMFRLYNPYSGEHFYTGDANERNALTSLGWNYEGVGWNAPTSGANVYRLYNRFSGDHHFTTDAGEKDACVAAGWTYEGVGWKSGGSVRVYREYNPYAEAFYHNYTANANEHRTLCSIGWKDEGIGWYGV